MKIIVDEEGKKALTTLVDTALKAHGLQALQLANMVNGACEDYKEVKTDGE